MATAYQGDKPYIFLSYAHKDKELAHQVVDYLHEHNFKVWFDEGIHTGAQWKKFILEKIANPNCWIMVFLATQNSLNSEECEKELYFAEEKKKKFINVVIGSPQFPDWFICDFKRYQFVDEAEFASRDAMMDKLVKELIHHQMNTDKPTDTAKETPKETPKAKAPEVAKAPKASTPIPESLGPSVAPKGPLKLNAANGLKFTVTDGTATVTGYTGTETKVIIPAKITYDGNSYKVTSIGDRAFADCKNLTSVSIPDSVTTIGVGAFWDCSSLTSITIPDGVTSIGDGAFADCTHLTSITIPNSVTSIDDCEFWGCTNLTSITIPNSVTSIGESAFYDCTNLTSITIPESVTSIGDDAFFYCENLTSINIPDSVTTIGDYALQCCKNLTSINVDKNNTHYKSIDGNLYSKDGTILIQYAIGKTNTSFTIPNGVTTIGESAFGGCTSLTSVSIPKGVKSIGERTFEWCSSLTSISIPNGVTSIGESAFYFCRNLTSITIPESVTSIGKQAFWWCSSLTSITIPDSVTSVGIEAFGNCENLTIYCEAKSKPSNWHTDWNPNNRPVVWGHGSSNQPTAPKDPLILYTADGWTFALTDGTATIIGYKGTNTKVIIPAKISYDGKTYKVTSIGERAFYYCKNLTSITIPNSITSIGNSAFEDCTRLTSISIPNSVTTIGERAFSSCDNLPSIIIPNSVTTIGVGAFAYCKNLTIYCETKSKPTSWDADWNFSKRPVIWGHGSSSPKEDEVCESSKPSTDSTTTPKPSPTEGLKFTVTDGTATVTGYTGTETKVIIPFSITYEGKSYKVTSIGERAFAHCSILTSITIPNIITSIDNSAFGDCTRLTSISIPNSVTTIGERAFSCCDNLPSIIIPNSVTTIGVGAFAYCKNLTIYCETKSKPTSWEADWNFSKRPVIWGYGSSSPKEDKACGSSKPSTDSTTIPKPSPTEGLEFSIVDGTARVDRYKGTDTKVIIPSAITYNGKTYKVTSIGEKAFFFCSSLTSVTIPDSVTSIGESAFFLCKKLISVTIPSSVTIIGKEAFYHCENLTSITIPDSVTSIGERTFAWCTSLTSITIPDSVTSIGKEAFKLCKKLTAVSIPNSVTTIGESAFWWCKSLTSITIPDSVTSIGINAFEWCDKLTIYCEAKSKPEGWHAKWNPRNRPVVWGHKIN